MKQIIVFKEKHGNEYYDASTVELRDHALLTVLRSRYEENWYYEPQLPALSDDLRAYLAMDAEEVSALPEGLRKVVTAAVERHEREQKEYRSAKRAWEVITELATLPFEEALALRANNGRVSLVYLVMGSRASHEYEGWEVVRLSNSTNAEA